MLKAVVETPLIDAPGDGRRPTLRQRGREWLGVAGVCLALALAYSFASKLRGWVRGESVDWGAIPTDGLVHFGCWALLYPAVALLTARFPLGERRRHLLVHAGAALLFSPLLMALSGTLNTLARGQTTAWASLLRDTIAPELAWGVTAYIVLLSMAHAAEFRRRDQARAIGEARLQAALAGARLDALRKQLEPHFLFNALNSIASLLRRDPDGAERMLARLGDFLRLTLDETTPQKVELRRELQLLDRYLGIERVRFRDRLTVAVEVPPELLGAQVPYLVLQPLVENAIRHGIAERAGPGKVVVRASRVEGSLRLRVEDDGPGLDDDGRPPKLGVGLSNMRARLEQLYGSGQRLTIESRPEQGARVTIDLPWEPAAATDEAAKATP